MKLTLTKIPQLNSIVLKQEGGHFFIAAPNAFIIDKAGLMTLIIELLKIGFLEYADLEAISEELYSGKDTNEN